MKEFRLEIVTPDGLVFDGMVESILVNTDEGYVEFLAGHSDYAASLTIGKARIKQNGKDRYAAVSGGFITVSNKSVKLIAITFEFAEDIDVNRAKLAKEKATAFISSSNDSKAIEIAKIKLQRAITRIHVTEL